MMKINRSTKSSTIGINSQINSSGTYSKAASEFGSLVVEEHDHSLCYSLSPFHRMKAFSNITNISRIDDLKRILPFGSIPVTPETKNKTSKKNEKISDQAQNTKMMDCPKSQKENIRGFKTSKSKLQTESL